MLRFKRFLVLPLVVGALVQTSCTKEADEPTPSTRQNEATGDSFVFTLEGIREEITDSEGRALTISPIANTSGNKIARVAPSTFKGKVKGVAYFYDPNTGDGFPRVLDFDVDGPRISYSGEIQQPKRMVDGAELKRYYPKVSIYVGGNPVPFKGSSKLVEEFTYAPSSKALYTVDGLDLGQFNPLFVSEANDVNVNPKQMASGRKGAMAVVRFRLFGEFLNIRFRNRKPNKTLRFDGLAVTGYASWGLKLRKPVVDKKGFFYPALIPNGIASSSKAFDGRGGGIFHKFTPATTYQLAGPASGQPETLIPGDPSYTIYVWSNAEPDGGIRFAYQTTRNAQAPFTNATMTDNVPNYFRRVATTFGKYRNLSLNL